MKKFFKSLAYSLSFLTLAGVVFLGGVVNKLLVKTHLSKDSEIGDRLNDLYGIPSAKADAPESGGGPANGPAPSGGPCPNTGPSGSPC